MLNILGEKVIQEDLFHVMQEEQIIIEKENL